MLPESSAKPGDDGEVGRLHDAVVQDTPYKLYEQAEAWNEVAAELGYQAEALRSRTEQVRQGWTSDGSNVYLTQLESRAEQLRLNAEIAARNGQSWTAVAERVALARTQAQDIWDRWYEAKKDAGTDPTGVAQKRIPFDAEAMNVMAEVVDVGATHGLAITPIDDYEPMPGNTEATKPGPGMDTAPPGGDPGAGLPGSGMPGAVGPTATGPVLQGPGGLAPVGQPPVVTTPGIPPGAGMPPGGPVPGLPPGMGPVPPSGGLPPRGATPPVRYPGVRPTPGLRPALTPRPSVPTVRPVIGARPGSSGMAPTVPRGGQGLTRPVIGARPGGPGARPGMPGYRPGGSGMPGARPSGYGPGMGANRAGAGVPGRPGTPGSPMGRGAAAGAPRPTAGGKALIGRNGVIGQPRASGFTRTPQPPAGKAFNRPVVNGVRQAFGPNAAAKTAKPTEKERDTPIQQEGGDYIWKPEGTTVPAVIAGGDSWVTVDHKAEAAWDLQPSAVQVSDESAVVDRLSERRDEPDNDQSNDLWQRPKTAPGVIRPSPPDDGFGFRF